MTKSSSSMRARLIMMGCVLALIVIDSSDAVRTVSMLRKKKSKGKDKKIAEDALSKFEESSRGLVDNITSDAMKSILSSGSNPMEVAAAIENNDTSEEEGDSESKDAAIAISTEGEDGDHKFKMAMDSLDSIIDMGSDGILPSTSSHKKHGHHAHHRHHHGGHAGDHVPSPPGQSQTQAGPFPGAPTFPGMMMMPRPGMMMPGAMNAPLPNPFAQPQTMPWAAPAAPFAQPQTMPWAANMNGGGVTAATPEMLEGMSASMPAAGNITGLDGNVTSDGPFGIKPEYAAALAKARAQEQMEAQETMIAQQMKMQHDMAVAKAEHDKRVVAMLKNMTKQWEIQANNSALAAEKAEKLMMQINGAQIARAKLEEAAKEEIAAKREQAISEASIKHHEEMLAELKNQSDVSGKRATNASSALEEAFKLFQENSNRTGAAALAKQEEAIAQLGTMPSLPDPLNMPGFGAPTAAAPPTAPTQLLSTPPTPI